MLRSRRPLLLLGIMLCLSGCQSYATLALEQRPHLASRLSDLKLGPASEASPGGAVDPDRPLTAAGLALLVVENNPDLRAARARRGVSEAQVVQAGLLPNPQLTGSLGFLLGGPGTANAWTAGLGEDVKALVTLSATRAAARASLASLDAELLWQEWQTVSKARLLFVDTVEAAQQRRLLVEEEELFADRYRRSKRAVEQGNLPLSAAVPDLAALSDVENRLADLDRQAETRQHDLDALLGLSPEVVLNLDPHIDLPPLDATAVEGMLPQLAQRRPDLVALRLGYEAEEAKLRGAILAQFPALILGGTGGRDTTGVLSAGPSITIDLPIFNRNQGNIAIERAPRAELHAEFTARLTAATGEVRALIAEQALLQRQVEAARSRLPELETASARADTAFRAGNLDERGYVDLAASLIAQRQTIVALEQSLLEQQVALATLTGEGMPVATLPPAAEVSR